eukprot:TRINITY_DN22275_c0_g1_i1.p1 TRINITY_DN22275_c0_g1~~TRINITY_DN22275_c0_g1_i1.p1  ORF type:complete len:192 (+),score=39.05 TRINITY_DN22275_c0_g1_i1:33-608(+)
MLPKEIAVRILDHLEYPWDWLSCRSTSTEWHNIQKDTQTLTHRQHTYIHHRIKASILIEHENLEFTLESPSPAAAQSIHQAIQMHFPLASRIGSAYILCWSQQRKDYLDSKDPAGGLPYSQLLRVTSRGLAYSSAYADSREEIERTGGFFCWFVRNFKCGSVVNEFGMKYSLPYPKGVTIAEWSANFGLIE